MRLPGPSSLSRQTGLAVEAGLGVRYGTLTVLHPVFTPRTKPYQSVESTQ